MADDDKKTNPTPAPKNDALPKNTTPPDASASKAEGGQKDADLSSSYSRGEGQKPVSQAYKDNWNLIFAKERRR